MLKIAFFYIILYYYELKACSISTSYKLANEYNLFIISILYSIHKL